MPDGENPGGRRIAIVFRGIGDIGGTNNTIADHARQFESLGYQVDLIGEKINRTGLPDGTGRGIRISRLPLAGRYKWQWFARRAQRVVDRGGYDFVAGHGHHYRQSVLSMHNCLHRAYELVHDTPMRTVHGLAQVHDRLFSHGRFVFCICNSRLMQAEIAARYGVAIERLPIIYPGYRPDRFNRADRERYRDPVRAELGCGDCVLIGLVTSGDFAKRGLDTLLEGYARLPDAARRRARLLVLGKLGKSARFTERARSLGIADQIHFVPHTREPQRYFHALDICVHPARYEEFGQTVQEAMACGVPVVTTRRVGAAELYPASVYRTLPAAPEPAWLAHRMASLIESPALRRELAETAHGDGLRHTDAENFRQTLDVYRQAGLSPA